MAKIGRRPAPSPSHIQRVSPIKPGLTGARNWATAQLRAATYTRKAFVRLTFSIVLILGLIVFGGLWLGGYLPNVKQASQDFSRARLISMGFVIKRVDVMGEGRLRESEVRDSLGVTTGDFLFDLDTQSAQNRIESLSWVDHAVVRRLWPDRVVVQIIERRPYALWQNDGTIKVVDASGAPITDASVERYYDLPLVVGPKAAEEAAYMHAALASYPDIAARVDAIVHVDMSRWDLKLRTVTGQEDVIWVKLPPKNMSRALRHLAELQAGQAILDREIGTIDLRLPDRITLTPSTLQRA